MNLRKRTLFVLASSIAITSASQLSIQAANQTGQFSASVYQNMNSDFRIAYTSHVTQYGFSAALGTCEEELRDACIDSVEIEIDGLWHKLLATTLSDDEISCPGCSGYDALWSGNPNANLPAGHRPSRWSWNGVSLGVDVKLDGSPTTGNDSNPVRDSLNQTGGYFLYSSSLRISAGQGQVMPDQKFRVSIKPRLQKSAFAGFYEGRLRGGEIAYTDDDQITFSGNPALITLPATPVWNFAEVPATIKTLFAEMAKNNGLPSQYDISKLGPSDSSVFFSFNNNVAQFETIEPYFDQTLSKDRYSWSITNQQNTAASLKGGCFQNQFGIGMATTNASMYTAGIPEWDASTQSLRIFMASPHLTGQRKLAVGNYDLSLRENVAKCIWGLSKIPEKASFEITYSDGNAEIGTVTLGLQGGFVNFHVNGFHFSSPQIALKLEGPKPEPTPAIEEQKKIDKTPVISTKNKLTILCKKNLKTVKKTGINPVCPKGYKKVA